jgi:DnaJ family protein C protein 28
MTQRKSPGDWESWIDEQIREAEQRGEFDNLPGKGKPLDLTPNPYAHEQELAFKILKDAGYAPEWIELDKTIRGNLERAEATLARQWKWYQDRLSELADRSGGWAEAERKRALAAWQQAVATFKLTVESINAEITELNLKVPDARFQRSKVDATREVDRLTREPSE